MKILISSGGTREMIDEVRFISNVSSGSTGAKLATLFQQSNHEVYFLHGQGAITPESDRIQKINFTTFENLNQKLETLLREVEFDIVIHAAAVSDYSLDKVLINGISVDKANKLASNQEATLKLKPNFKILPRLKSYAHYPFMLVGFKLTYQSNPDEERRMVSKLFNNSGVNYVVHNDYSLISSDQHPFKIYNQDLKVIAEGSTKNDLFHELTKLEFN